MRTLDATQESLVQSKTTKPIFLIEMNYTGVEYLSTNGDITVDGIAYTGSDIGLSGSQDWTRATIKLVPTPDRVSDMLSGAWRRGTCKISLLPVIEFPRIFEEGYVENDQDYALQGTVVGEPILLIDGLLTAGQYSQELTLTVTHKSLVGMWTPRLRITNEWCNHLPQPGTQLKWQGDIFTLESRR